MGGAEDTWVGVDPAGKVDSRGTVEAVAVCTMAERGLAESIGISVEQRDSRDDLAHGTE